MEQPDKTGQLSPKRPSIAIPEGPLAPSTVVSQGRTLQRIHSSIPILVNTYPRDTSQEAERYRYFLPKEDSRFKPDINGETPLTRALYEHIEDETNQKLEKIQRDINQALSDLNMLYQRNPVAAQLVVNQADDEGDTALIYAATFGKADLFEPLFKLGANPCLETKRRSLFLLFNTHNKLPGVNLATSALKYLYAMKQQRQFDIASEMNRMNVKRSPYTGNEHESILHRAMTCRPPIVGIGHVINRLLEYGADPNLINTKGQIPLHLAEHLPNEEWPVFLKTLINKTKRESITRYLSTIKGKYAPIFGSIRNLYTETYQPEPAVKHHTQYTTIAVTLPTITLKPVETLSPDEKEHAKQAIMATAMAPMQPRPQALIQPIRPKMEGSPPKSTDVLTPSRQKPSPSSFPASRHLQYLTGLASQTFVSSTVEPYSHVLRESTVASPVIRLSTPDTSERQPPRLSHRTASATAVRESETAGPVSVALRPQRSAMEQTPPIGSFIESYRASQVAQPPRIEEPDFSALMDEPVHLPVVATLSVPELPKSSPEVPFYLRPGSDKSTALLDAIVYYYDPVAPTDTPALKKFKKNIIPFLEKAMPHLARFAETHPEKAKELINYADADGDTALNCAASIGLTDLFKPLIHAGADISLERSSTSFHYALAVTKEQYGVSNYECLKLLIEAINASGKFTQAELRDQINKKSNRLRSGRLIQQTALHKALSQPYKHHWKIVSLLLEHGADPNVTDQDNQTALDLAINLPFPESRDILTMIAAKTSIPTISECVTQTNNTELKQLLEEQLQIRKHQQYLSSTQQSPIPIFFTETEEEVEPTLDLDFILSASQSTSGTASPFFIDIASPVEPEYSQRTESSGETSNVTSEISSPPVSPLAAEKTKEPVSDSEHTETGDDPNAAAETSTWVPSVERTPAPVSPEPPTPIDTTTKHVTPSDSETASPAKMGFDSRQYQQTDRRSTRLVALQTTEPKTLQPATKRGRKRKAGMKTPASTTKKITE